jgi:hypothetical protein
MNRVELQLVVTSNSSLWLIVENLNLRRATVEAANKLTFPEGRHISRLRTSAKEGKRENGLSCSDHMNDVDHMITVSVFATGTKQGTVFIGSLRIARRTIATRTLP